MPSKDRLLLSIPANTYTNRGQALAAIKAKFDELSGSEKYRTYIVQRFDEYTIQNVGVGVFAEQYAPGALNKMVFQYISLSESKMVSYEISSSGSVSVSDLTENAQDRDMSLYVRAY